MGVAVGVFHTLEIRMMLVFPTAFELLGAPSAAFRETGIAHRAFVGQDLASRGSDGFLHLATGSTGDALIALAVVVGTDIKDSVVFAVVPADEFVVCFFEGEEILPAVAQ